MRFTYSDEMLDYIEYWYKHLPITELTRWFNSSFGTDKKETAIHTLIGRKGFLSGRDGKFKPGEKPWNDGKRGYMGPNSTSFKKGNVPHNHKPLFSERVGKDGYIEISVPEKNTRTGFYSKYKPKHVWMWEQRFGKVKKGDVVIFKDGDKTNIIIDNLTTVSRAELLWLNRNGNSNLPLEMKETMRVLAKVEVKKNEIERHGTQKNG